MAQNVTLHGRMTPLLDALQGADKANVRRAVEGLVALAVEEPGVERVLDAQFLISPLWTIAYTLGQIARPSAPCLEVLVQGLGSGDQDIRWATQLLLADLGASYPEVMLRLKLLVRDGSSTQRRMAVYCLRDIGAAGLSGLLLGSMEDSEPLVRVAAVTSLTKFLAVGIEELAALRKAATEDPDVRVRNAATFAVKRLADA